MASTEAMNAGSSSTRRARASSRLVMRPPALAALVLPILPAFDRPPLLVGWQVRQAQLPRVRLGRPLALQEQLDRPGLVRWAAAQQLRADLRDQPSLLLPLLGLRDPLGRVGQVLSLGVPPPHRIFANRLSHHLQL